MIAKFILIVLINYSLQTDKFAPDTAVNILTTATFKELNIGFQNIEIPYLIMFYAPWCPHCKRLIPTWEKLAINYQGKVGIGSVDCTEHSELQERFSIRGYPTLLYFTEDNQMIQYRGERSFEKLSDFLDGGYKELEKDVVPQTADKMKQIKKQIEKPAVLIAIGVLILFTVILIVICYLDSKDNKKLNILEKELKLKQDQLTQEQSEEIQEQKVEQKQEQITQNDDQEEKLMQENELKKQKID